jgi:hypothetical protein
LITECTETPIKLYETFFGFFSLEEPNADIFFCVLPF